ALDVVERLQQRRDEDHPADADEAVLPDGLRAEQPLAAADRDAERDQAGPDRVHHELARPDPADPEDLLRGREVGYRQVRAADPERTGRSLHPGHRDLRPGRCLDGAQSVILVTPPGQGPSPACRTIADGVRLTQPATRASPRPLPARTTGSRPDA